MSAIEMMTMFERYGLWGVLKLITDRFLTFLTIRNARIIRRPVDIRCKKKMCIGHGFTTGRYCRLEAYGDGVKPSLVIGEHCQINDSVHIAAAEHVELGDNVLIASRVFITDLNHGSYSGEEHSHPDTICSERPLKMAPVYIESNVWLGEGVVVLPGVRIGQSSIVGANSVVTRSIPDNCIAAGNPAKIIKKFNSASGEWERV